MAAIKKTSTGKKVRATKVKKSPVKKQASSAAKKVVKKPKTAAKKKVAPPKKPKTSPKKKTAPNVKKIKPVKKETLIKSGGPLSFPRSVSLSVFIPALVPAHPDQLAIGLARFSGVFFVVLGALFAGYHSMAQFYPNTVAMVGLSQSASLGESCVAVSNSTHHDSQHCFDDHADIGDETPSVSFKVNQPAPVSETIDVLVSVEKASSVKLKAYAKSADEYYEIGVAAQKDDVTWKIDWDTTAMPDDEYILYAIIFNEYGSYDAKSKSTYVVENNFHVHTSHEDNKSDTETHALEHSDDLLGTERNITPDITSIDFDYTTNTTGSIFVNINVSDAKEVVLKGTHLDEKKEFFFGAATQKAINAWVLAFDKNDLPLGEYDVTIIAKSIEGLSDSTTVKLTLRDGVKEALSHATATKSVHKEETTVAKPEQLEPHVTIGLSAANGTVLTGLAKFTVEIPNAEFVEVYMVPEYTNSKRFVGLANKKGDGLWSHAFDTAELPNGTYRLFVRAKNSYGLFDSESVSVTIKNTVVAERTAKQEEYVETITVPETDPYIQPSENNNLQTSAANESVATATVPSASKDVLDQIEESLQAELHLLLNKLGAAIRIGDSELIVVTENEIFKLREKIETASLTEAERKALSEKLDMRLRELISRVEHDVEKTEKIVKERTGESASKDTDSDGIADYDEINIYKTDPFVADSDNDGFHDGAEILGGFNPVDPTPEALVSYESPKKSGVVRSDLLAVESITTITETESDSDGVSGRALISGRALPNSFVTIYIFSTPIVVTVKTDADGGWEYHFDKELEDGSHEVYVGVTDNTGKIVAKSEPLLFVKEAQAFTPVDAEEAAVSVATLVREDDSLVSNHMIMIIGSISVVTIGLVLILIGVFLARREEDLLVPPQANAVAV